MHVKNPGKELVFFHSSLSVCLVYLFNINIFFWGGWYCSIALFGSEDKANRFVPNAEQKKCIIVSSKTGKLIDIDVEAVKSKIQIFDAALALP